jgi:predicted RNA-binding protein with RPS1 domain
LHISQISDKFIKDIRKELHIGEKVKVKVIKIEEDGKIQLSKKAVTGGNRPQAGRRTLNNSGESDG